MSEAILQYTNARLFWNSLDLQEKVREISTPSFVYSRQILRKRFQLFQSVFPSARIHFAMKANHWAPLLQEMASWGAHVDVVSSGEIQKALECGFRADQILFSGVGKTHREIAYALEKDIFQINVESQDELDKIISFQKPVRIGLRWTPGLDVKTHPFIKTSHDDTKFGLSQEDIHTLIPKIQEHAFLQFQGLSLHLGSQILDLNDFRQAFREYKQLVMEFPLPSVNVDLGGGLGIDYHSQNLPEDEKRLQEYAAIVNEIWKGTSYQLLFEPGRFLSGRAGGLLTQVQAVKKTKSKTIVVVDAGMTNLLRPVLYEAHHEILPVTRRPGPEEVVDVVGPICESSDFLALNRSLPPLRVGDLLWVADCGAYGSSMSSDYNLRPRAGETWID